AAEGVRVGMLARGEQALRALASELGPHAFAVPCDVRDSNATDRAIAVLAEAMEGAPDIIVNNAGAFLIAPAHETTVDAFRDTLEVNLTAPFALVRAFLPVMRQRGQGHIVTIGSIADRTVFPGNAAYAASKHGLRALHEVLRAELRGTGVRASLVSPGPVNTELWDAIDPDNQPGFTPRAHMLSPDDVASAVLYLLSAPDAVNVDELRLSRS
ncbi:MAG: short-chain dehydrogenase/reductase, partial [Gemmatimonadetes bacterium]|nr:short-chain dehydrogenase/reductase [Gemmatimonadota bacterium]